MTVINQKRREHFQKQFETQPLGVLDLQKLSEIRETKQGNTLRIPKGTLTAFLRELQRAQRVQVEKFHDCRYSLERDFSVWSKIR